MHKDENIYIMTVFIWKMRILLDMVLFRVHASLHSRINFRTVMVSSMTVYSYIPAHL